MKPYVLLILAAFALLSFGSCKKNYTCTCKYHAGIPGLGSYDTTATIDLGKQKKKDAKKQCSGHESSATITDPTSGLSYTQSVTCSL